MRGRYFHEEAEEEAPLLWSSLCRLLDLRAPLEGRSKTVNPSNLLSGYRPDADRPVGDAPDTPMWTLAQHLPPILFSASGQSRHDG